MTSLPWAAAFATAYDAAAPLPARQVPLTDAVGCVLAEPMVALADVPSFDVAAMDGYAVVGAGPWRVRGRVLAGARWTEPLHEGEAVEIATGAPVPGEVTAVLPYEKAARTDDHVDGDIAVGRNIRRAGEEVRRGDALLPAGTVLAPLAIGLAATVGHDVLPVIPRPRVAVLVTGDELLRSGLPNDHRIRDALGPAVPALVAALGATVADTHHLADGAASLRTAISGTDADIVVTTGASSVGRADHLVDVLAHLAAEPLVDGVSCRPGHPMSLARLPSGQWVVGLPGNPLAASVAVVTLLAPLVAALAGRARPGSTTAVVGTGVPAHPAATRLVPVAVDDRVATPVAHHGPAMLRGAADATDFAVVPPAADLEPGAAVELLPIPGAARPSREFSQARQEPVREM